MYHSNFTHVAEPGWLGYLLTIFLLAIEDKFYLIKTPPTLVTKTPKIQCAIPLSHFHIYAWTQSLLASLSMGEPHMKVRHHHATDYSTIQ